MAYSKIIQDGEVLIDLTSDTVNTNALLSGHTAHIANGNIITGSITVPSVAQDSDNYIVLGSDGTSAVDYLDLRIRNEFVYKYENLNVISFDGQQILTGWSNLREFSLPNCTEITKAIAMGSNENDNLLIYLPKVQTIAAQSFQGTDCQTLTLPSITTIPNYALYSSKIPIVDLGANCTSITGNRSLDGNVSTLILRSSTLCTLANSNSLPPAVFGSDGTGGVIYVPSALISEYQAATNWSTIHNYGHTTWLAIEGSEYENYYADGRSVT